MVPIRSHTVHTLEAVYFYGGPLEYIRRRSLDVFSPISLNYLPFALNHPIHCSLSSIAIKATMLSALFALLPLLALTSASPINKRQTGVRIESGRTPGGCLSIQAVVQLYQGVKSAMVLQSIQRLVPMPLGGISQEVVDLSSLLGPTSPLTLD